MTVVPREWFLKGDVSESFAGPTGRLPKAPEISSYSFQRVSFRKSLNSSQLPIVGTNFGRCWSEMMYSRVQYRRCSNGPASGWCATRLYILTPACRGVYLLHGLIMRKKS